MKMMQKETSTKGREAVSVFERLESEMPRFTPAERAIAEFMLRNRAALAFETAASVADKLGLSKITVGRFVQRLGYPHFKGLKVELGKAVAGQPWLGGDRLTQFLETVREPGGLRGSLEREIEALVDAYRLMELPAWSASVALLARAGRVHVTGYPAYVALLADSLNFVRGEVEVVIPGGRGAVDAATPGDRCLVLIDSRRYALPTYLLAKAASEAGVPLIVIADRYCDWASALTPHVLTVAVDAGQLLDSPVGVLAVANLLTNSVAGLLGVDTVRTRLDRIAALAAQTPGYV
jgi:DNA-binding MurR/RpiR family transcriptional regulator